MNKTVMLNNTVEMTMEAIPNTLSVATPPRLMPGIIKIINATIAMMNVARGISFSHELKLLVPSNHIPRFKKSILVKLILSPVIINVCVPHVRKYDIITRTTPIIPINCNIEKDFCFFSEDDIFISDDRMLVHPIQMCD